MKIAVLNNCAPFISGGAEHLASALCTRLADHGHQAELIRIPFTWDPPERIVDAMLSCRLLRIANVDRVIALKFPAYLVPHDNKVLWLLHQFRQAYDFQGTEFQGLPDTAGGREIRDAVIQADNSFLPEARRIFTNSRVTGERLKRFNGLDSEVLHPPLLTAAAYRPGPSGDFVFCPGRINATKRQALLVQAMRESRTAVKLVIAGRSESADELSTIRADIHRSGLRDRVTIIDRFISDEDKIDLLSRCLAVAYIPYDEDSFGYVTLEARLSHKPVITCTDSGGTHDMVTHGVDGLIVAPEAKALADAMDRMFTDADQAANMGRVGADAVARMNIGWDSVIRRLLA